MMKISVIVPVYNSEEHLCTCLDSLVNQTLDDIEIIVVDDCSQDKSLDIINEYSKIYSNIKVIHNNKNMGQGKSRNIGINNADGEYISFVDSDDYINIDMYKNIYELANKNNNPDLLMTRLIFVKDDSYANKDLSFASSNRGRILNQNQKKDELLDISPSACNKLFKKELIDNYRFIENCKWEDVAFTTSMFIKAKSIMEVNNPDYFYRRNITKGVSSNNYKPNDSVFEIFLVTDEIIKNAKKDAKYELYSNQIKVLCVSTILQRIYEINEWDCSIDLKSEVISRVYNGLFARFGDLSDIDDTLLQTKIDYNVIDDYKNYISYNNKKVR